MSMNGACALIAPRFLLLEAIYKHAQLQAKLVQLNCAEFHSVLHKKFAQFY